MININNKVRFLYSEGTNNYRMIGCDITNIDKLLSKLKENNVDFE